MTVMCSAFLSHHDVNQGKVHNSKVCGQWPGREALLCGQWGPTGTFEQPGRVLETAPPYDQRIQLCRTWFVFGKASIVTREGSCQKFNTQITDHRTPRTLRSAQSVRLISGRKKSRLKRCASHGHTARRTAAAYPHYLAAGYLCC